MARFLLVARDAGDWSEAAGDISPEQIEAILSRYNTWSEKLVKAGKLEAGEKLADGEGRQLSAQNGLVRVLDGPHSASKEVVGGFWILNADDYEDAVKLASDCPHLEFGTLEIRKIEEIPA